MFKVFIGLSTGDYRDEAEQVVDSITRTMAKNHRMARELTQGSRHVYAWTGCWQFHEMVKIPFSREVYNRVVSKIVRGLFWQRTGQILGEASIHVAHGAELERWAVEKIRPLMLTERPTVLNGGTFTYIAFFKGKESFWELSFFGRHTAYAVVCQT